MGKLGDEFIGYVRQARAVLQAAGENDLAKKLDEWADRADAKGRNARVCALAYGEY